jgi:hypothetical protein
MHDEPYFAKWNISYLEAFIRDKGFCQYCDPKRYLFESYDLASCGDHLLPRKTHKDAVEDVDNIVACCTECNQLKRDFDPSENDPGKLSDPRYRQRVIEKVRAHVGSLRTDRNWRQQFERARARFERAVAEYNKPAGEAP